MFEKFGELNSFGEINELAENLFNEGDTESLKAMAKENGIQSDFVDMYLQGEIPVLCDQLTAQSQGEEIAPAQKSTETLEKEEVEDDETGENESSDAENKTAESEPETAEREQTEETEVIEAAFGTRKEYMDRLSIPEMAEYLVEEYQSHRLMVPFAGDVRAWLSEKVDRFGKPMEG